MIWTVSVVVISGFTACRPSHIKPEQLTELYYSIDRTIIENLCAVAWGSCFDANFPYQYYSTSCLKGTTSLGTFNIKTVALPYTESLNPKMTDKLADSMQESVLWVILTGAIRNNYALLDVLSMIAEPDFLPPVLLAYKDLLYELNISYNSLMFDIAEIENQKETICRKAKYLLTVFYVVTKFRRLMY